ncbi:MAG TPA: bifunctional UDP-N-acetylglucosamine diphosphorylase/glucosamine-1-phosphate N-acetyltransferase GlmU [Terriglobales bacterium]|nr:bifunctional UDP-N-acetylglucosamine diphosphorylase/glucosamine-1-phosphate N-acetyltransferase GlmU [Terriglobales bacterium]
MSTTAVLILAAGRGTRLRSHLPKVLHRAGGDTLLGHVLGAARGAGIADADIAVVAGFGADQVRAAVHPLRVIVQEPQLGTGHAVQVAESWWRGYERLIVLNGDMPLLSAATVAALAGDAQGMAGAAAVLATAAPAEPRPYGRIIRDAAHPERVLAIVEDRQTTPEQAQIRELNAGFYGMRTSALGPALARLGRDNPHGEYYLTDVVALLAGAGEGVAALPLTDPDECLGVNDRAELAQLDRRLRRRKAAQLMAAGVSLENPGTVDADAAVTVGMDTVIEPGVRLLGTTKIGENCRIGAGSILTDCELGDGVVVRPYSVLESARVEAGAQIGPFSRLRPGAAIGAGAHVGNFVEVKNTRLGARSKANHLAYLGDATVGEDTNIGAGVITCNYDGSHKHPTQIGSGSFVGSNATLVAPVTVGDGAFIAAASVVTEDVPADALALGRARQQNKPGWAARRRRP